MAFVNEYATDEDIEKYGLNDIWDRYMARRNTERFFGRRPELTIDREQDVVLMVASSGAVGSGTQFEFVLLVRSQVVIVRMNLVSGSSLDFSEKPFYRVWDLANFKKQEGCELSNEEIIDKAKEAVTAYGYRGVRRQIPETVVKFSF
jgi:hypothetical protein